MTTGSNTIDWNGWAAAAREDPDVFNRLAVAAAGMIRRAAAGAVHHFVSESDEEWSVALLAFYEAVQGYRPEMGSFPGFAGLVIRRRLIDWSRKSASEAEILVAPERLDGQVEEEEYNGLDERIGECVARRYQANGPESSALRDEIEALQNALHDYGFSFFDLPACSPKAEKTKKACGRAVRTMLTSPGLLERMRKTGTLPMKDLQERSGVPGKVLERHRRYIITAVLILWGDYPGLAEYLRGIKTETVEMRQWVRGGQEAMLVGFLLLFVL